MTQKSVPDRATEGMVDYDDNSLAQRQDTLRNSDVIFELANRLSDLPGGLNITDYGCGPGQSAIDTVKPAIEAWRQSAPGKPVTVCHADQPGNDWNALMGIVFGKSGYAGGEDAPQVNTSVGTFFNQMASSASVSLATCFAASHWLSSPFKINAPDTVWFADLPEQAHKQMRERALQDWSTFLRHRAKELHSGGYLFVSTLGAVPSPGDPNDKAVSGRGVYRAFQAVTASMKKDGLLDAKTADDFVFSFWFLSEKEARQPFETDEELATAYEIELIKVGNKVEGGDVFGAYIENPADYARRYCGFTHAFASSTLRNQLFAPSSSGKKEEIDRLETEFFRRMKELYKEKTNTFAFEQWHLRVILKRR
ncbi:hypothetical protein ABLO27_00855 [Roseibium sp. SCPC15]|uniref:hypothetical protein n=1 Tax=Roseibium sp. SCP15 TaxID=3141376 RepID=UPI00333DFF32